MLKETILKEITDFIKIHKKSPRVRDIPCIKDHYRKYFNSWADAVSVCGGYVSRQKLNQSEEEFKEWLKNNCKITNDSCWEWQKNINQNGYGITYYKKKAWYAHRLSYTLFIGKIPPKKLIQHKCDNTKCINPNHLEIGTHQSNRNDSQKKGRWTYGKKPNKQPPYKISNKEKLRWYEQNHEEVNGGLDTKCWIVIGGSLEKGSLTLYRTLYITKFNNTPEIVGHRCHNKGCINPDHLYGTTRSQNARDSIHYHPNTKITKEQAREILLDYFQRDFEWGEKKQFDQYWAEKLNIHASVIPDIRCGNSWLNVRKEILDELQN